MTDDTPADAAAPTDGDAVTTPEVLEGGAAVTADWLTGVLRRSGALGADESVTRVDHERIGTGQMGVCDRLSLVIDDGSGGRRERTLVAKFASDDSDVRSMMGPTGYAAEIEFYLDVAPRLGGNIPRCHHAAIDRTSFGFTLLLDDLAPAVAGDQCVPLSVPDAVAGVDELVELHHPYWDAPSLDTERCLTHAPLGDGALQQVYQMAVPGFLERFGEALGPTRAAIYERLTTGTEAWQQRRPAHRTIVHGDFRADNLMFRREGDVVVSPVDFQGIRSAPGAVDVAFFLGTSLTTEDRRAEETRLIRRWYDARTERGVSGYPWEECLADYRWSTVAALTTTVLGAAFSTTTERGEEMFTIMSTRQADQILDHGADALLDR